MSDGGCALLRIEVRLSSGAFGQRRKEAGWSGNPTSGDWTQITATTRRGFTFHEHLDNLNLVHMNGRAYDPVVGRFLSADPFVPHPTSTQSFNRYSYVQNNPLTGTDPSGFADTSTRNTAEEPDFEARRDAQVMAWARTVMLNGGDAPSIWDFSSGLQWAQYRALGGFRGANGPLDVTGSTGYVNERRARLGGPRSQISVECIDGTSVVDDN